MLIVLKVLDDHTLAFADFSGNAQDVSIGNLAENGEGRARGLVRHLVFGRGQGFLMIKDAAVEGDSAAPSSRMILVQNFFEELKRLVPTNYCP